MTEHAKKLLLLYHEQSKKNRTIQGSPPLTFKGKGKDLKNYRIYGNTETKTRSYSGSAPLNFPIVDGSVSNYRIHGNTENGESVGGLVTDSQSEHYGKYAIPITNNSETSNIYLDEPLTKSGNNADYIDYAEQKRYNADGTSEDITLPALPSQSSSNSLSVGTAVQPSSLAVDVDEVVSCGDRTGNLFDLNTWANTIRNINGNGLMSISGNTISITSVNSTDCFTMPYVDSQIGVYKIPVKPNTIYTVNWYGSKYRILLFKNGTLDRIYTYDTSDDLRSFTTDSDATFITIRFGVKPTNPVGTTATISDFMISEGSTALPYEPYGYKIHVTLTADSTETTDIYLDEPLAKSGNNTDYIDYATQKRHNSDGTESSVTLPEISTLAGTNTLSVGTEVQPSEVEINGRIKAVQEGGGQNES